MADLELRERIGLHLGYTRAYKTDWDEQMWLRPGEPPAGHIYIPGKLPRFELSFDACEEMLAWLKLRSHGLAIDWVERSGIWKVMAFKESGDVQIKGEGATLQSALCAAIDRIKG